MESSKEKIEAQLCAYIDGQLTDAERADIERHLAANPQHKALIADLRQTSDLLRSLPRAKAPHELNEAICGPLERSSLLSPSEEETRQTVLSINRWPQITAVAAVLLLAVGLGVVVYYVLPASTPTHHDQVATNDKNLTPPADGVVADRSLGSKSAPAERAAQGPDLAKRKASGYANAARDFDRDAPPEKSFDDATRSPQPPKGIAFSAPDPAAAAPGAVATSKDVAEVRSRLTPALGLGRGEQPADQNSVYLVVSTPNAQAAATQINAYFKAQDITFQSGETTRGSTDAFAYREKELSRKAEYESFGLSNGRPTSPAPAESEKSGGTPAAGGAGGGAGSLDKRLADGSSRPAPAEKPNNYAGGIPKSDAAADAVALADETMKKRPSLEAKDKTATDPQQPQGGRDDSAAIDPRKAPRKATEDERALQYARNPAQAQAGEKGKDQADAKQTSAPDARGVLAKGAGAQVIAGLALEQQRRAAGGATDAAAGLDISPTAANSAFGASGAAVTRPPGTVFFARMNRRQAGELKAALSGEPGQRAELKTLAAMGDDPAITYRYLRESTDLLAARPSLERGEAIATPKPTNAPSAPPAASAPVPTANGPDTTLADKPAPRAKTEYAAPTAAPTTRPITYAADAPKAPAMARTGAPPKTAEGLRDRPSPGSGQGIGHFAEDAPANDLHLRAEAGDEPVNVVIILNDESVPALQLTPAATEAPKGEQKAQEKK